MILAPCVAALVIAGACINNLRKTGKSPELVVVGVTSDPSQRNSKVNVALRFTNRTGVPVYLPGQSKSSLPGWVSSLSELPARERTKIFGTRSSVRIADGESVVLTAENVEIVDETVVAGCVYYSFRKLEFTNLERWTNRSLAAIGMNSWAIGGNVEAFYVTTDLFRFSAAENQLNRITHQ